jgi:hypothetical protein
MTRQSFVSEVKADKWGVLVGILWRLALFVLIVVLITL